MCHARPPRQVPLIHVIEEASWPGIEKPEGETAPRQAPGGSVLFSVRCYHLGGSLYGAALPPEGVSVLSPGSSSGVASSRVTAAVPRDVPWLSIKRRSKV